MHACCSWSQLVATASNKHSNIRRWSKSCTECEIEVILKRGLSLASGRVAATSEQHRFKLNRCECDFTDLKNISLSIGAFSASLILVYPILFVGTKIGIQNIFLYKKSYGYNYGLIVPVRNTLAHPKFIKYEKCLRRKILTACRVPSVNSEKISPSVPIPNEKNDVLNTKLT